MVNLFVNINGNLEITVNDRESYVEYFRNVHYNNPFNNRDETSSLLDSSGYLGNDWHGDILFALSDAPNICYGASYTETDDSPVDFEQIFYYPDYMIKDWKYELFRRNKVVFSGV